MELIEHRREDYLKANSRMVRKIKTICADEKKNDHACFSSHIYLPKTPLAVVTIRLLFQFKRLPLYIGGLALSIHMQEEFLLTFVIGKCWNILEISYFYNCRS